MKKQTPIDCFFEKITNLGFVEYPEDLLLQQTLREAKELEKEHIQNSYDSGLINGFEHGVYDNNLIFEDGEQYYKEIYE